MKTNEELKAMTQDELVAYAEKLQSELEEYKNQRCIFQRKRKRLNQSSRTSRTWSSH